MERKLNQKIMNKIIFVSNVEDSNKLEKLGTILGDVSNIQVCYHKIDNSSDYDDITNEYGDNTIITEEIEIIAFAKNRSIVVTKENIELVKTLFLGVKLIDDERELSIYYTYKIFIKKEEIFKTYKKVRGVLSNKKIGKSSVYFENYIINVPEWKVMSKISDDDKYKMTGQRNMIQKIYSYYVCHFNNIDITKLMNYTMDELIKGKKSSYQTSREFFTLYSDNTLTVGVKEYFLSEGWNDWILSGNKTVDINLNTINSEIKEYEARQTEIEREKAEIRAEEIRKEEERKKKEEEKREEEKRQESNRRNSCSSSSSSSSSSSFDWADYNRRGQEGNGWSEEIPGFTNDEVEAYRDRVYERETGRGRYDM